MIKCDTMFLIDFDLFIDWWSQGRIGDGGELSEGPTEVHSSRRQYAQRLGLK